MSFTLGFTPEKFKLVVTAGSDFFCSLTRKDGTDWAVGTELTLDFHDAAPPWTATVEGPTATWSIDQDDVDALIAARPRSVSVVLHDGETRLIFAKGAVVATG